MAHTRWPKGVGRVFSPGPNANPHSNAYAYICPNPEVKACWVP